MNYRDDNNNPYQVGHIYYMYSHYLEIIEFEDNGKGVILLDIHRPGTFTLSLVNGWKYVRAAVKPKNNREALSLLEKE